jgi:hypothetical protein
MNAVMHDAALRRAALAVHAMTVEDREWLLRELPSAERTHLQPLLAELAELGIPPDADLLKDAALLPKSDAGGSEPTALSASSARSLARWLRPQPVQVTARLLRMSVLQALPRETRTPLESLLVSLPPAPELERLVVAAARRYLAAAAAPSGLSWLRNFSWPSTRGERR